MHTPIDPFRPGPRRPIRWALVVGVFSLLAAGCKGVLEVDHRGRVAIDRLDDPSLAGVLVNGALGEVECAWDSYIAAAAWLSDQYEPASGNTYMWNLAARRVTVDDKMLGEETCDGQGIGAYVPLQVARYQAEDVIRRLRQWIDAGASNLMPLEAKVRAYGAYMYLALGEGFESVAFGDGRFLPPDSALARAEEWFTAALDIARNDSIVNLARVGRARTRLNRGDRAGAAADARLVPPGFRLLVTRDADSNRRMNKLYFHRLAASVAEAYRSLTIGGLRDPRVPIAGPVAMAAIAAGYYATKYTSEASPHRLASYKEAQYILAEVSGGQSAVDIINALRDSVGLPHFAGGTDAQIHAEILDERAREFFAEGGLRLNDLLRHDLTWKTGVEPNLGLTYGNTRRFPLPRNEREGVP